jgi:hypothetical protein
MSFYSPIDRYLARSDDHQGHSPATPSQSLGLAHFAAEVITLAKEQSNPLFICGQWSVPRTSAEKSNILLKVLTPRPSYAAMVA